MTVSLPKDLRDLEFVVVSLLGLLFSNGTIVCAQGTNSEELRELLELQDRLQRMEQKESERKFESIREDAQEDIGVQEILRKRPEHRTFQLLGSVNERFTTNAALSPFLQQSDLLTTVSGGLAYTPFPGSRYNPRPIQIRLRTQFFRYRNNPVYNFNRLNLEVGGTYRHVLSEVPFFLTGRYSFEELRYGSSSGGVEYGDLIRSYHVLQGSAYHILRLTRYQALIPEVAVEMEFTRDLNGKIGSRADNEKNKFSVLLTYFYEYSRKLNVYGLTQFRRSEYNHVLTVEGLRIDHTYSASFGTSWSFNDFSSMRLTASYSHNNSNSFLFEYEVSNVGTALRFNYKF